MFSPTSGKGNSFEPMPPGTLAWALIKVESIENSKNTSGEYVKMELTIVDHPQFTGRKLFRVMLPNPFDPRNETWTGSSGWTNWTRLLEAVGTFNGVHPDSYNVFHTGTHASTNHTEKFRAMCLAIDGKTAGVKIKLVPEKDGFEAKNEVADWASPNKQTIAGYKLWEKIKSQDAALPSNAISQELAAKADSFSPTASTFSANSAAKPAWL